MQVHVMKRKLNILTAVVVISNLLMIVVLCRLYVNLGSHPVAVSTTVNNALPTVKNPVNNPLKDERTPPLGYYHDAAADQNKAVSIVLFQFN